MNWKRAAIAAGVAIPVIGVLAFGLTRDPKDIPSPMPGRTAPAFALPVFAPGNTPPYRRALGDTVRLGALKDTVVVLNFWASWCMPCRVEHPTLTAVAQNFTGEPVRFVGVLYNDSNENGSRWIEMMGGQAYPALSDPGARTAISYGVYGVPETYFIDGTGKVVYKHTGPIPDSTLTQKIDSLLKARATARRTGP